MALELAGIGSLIGAGASLYSLFKSGDAAEDQMKLIEQQMAEARAVRKENRAVAEDTYADVNSLLDSIPGIQSFLEEGKELADSQREDRMRFILGDTEDNLRKAQGINTKLAAFDFSDINSEISKILQTNLFDISSLTRDASAGAFANLSVQNMAGLAAQGTQNALNIGDYIGRISGIDEFNPYRMAQDLFSVELGKTNSRISALTHKANLITDNNNQWFNNFSDLSQAQMVTQANKSNAQIGAVTSLASTLGNIIGSIPEQRALNAQTDFFKAQTQRVQQMPVG